MAFDCGVNVGNMEIDELKEANKQPDIFPQLRKLVMDHVLEESRRYVAGIDLPPKHLGLALAFRSRQANAGDAGAVRRENGLQD